MGPEGSCWRGHQTGAVPAPGLRCRASPLRVTPARSAQLSATQLCLFGSSLREGTEGRGWSALCSLPPCLQGHSELPALCCGVAPPAASQCAVACWEGRSVGPTAHAHVAGQGEQPALALMGPGATTAGVRVSPAWLSGNVGGTLGRLVRARPSPPQTHCQVAVL